MTTTVYLPQDRMALTLNGTTQWPSGRDLIRFGEARLVGSRKTLLAIFERISDALSATATDVRDYIKEHPEFDGIGSRMLAEWETGRKHSLSAGI